MIDILLKNTDSEFEGSPTFWYMLGETSANIGDSIDDCPFHKYKPNNSNGFNPARYHWMAGWLDEKYGQKHGGTARGPSVLQEALASLKLKAEIPTTELMA